MNRRCSASALPVFHAIDGAKMKFKLFTLFYDNYACERDGRGKMKAASRLVLMYLLLTGCLGLASLYVGCANWKRTTHEYKNATTVSRPAPARSTEAELPSSMESTAR